MSITLFYETALMLFSNLDIFIFIFYCIGILFLVQYASLSQSGRGKAAELSRINFKIEPSFNKNTLIIFGILIVTYLLLWL